MWFLPLRFCEKDAMEEIMSIFHQLPKGGSGTERLQVRAYSIAHGVST